MVKDRAPRPHTPYVSGTGNDDIGWPVHRINEVGRLKACDVGVSPVCDRGMDEIELVGGAGVCGSGSTTATVSQPAPWQPRLMPRAPENRAATLGARSADPDAHSGSPPPADHESQPVHHLRLADGIRQEEVQGKTTVVQPIVVQDDRGAGCVRVTGAEIGVG